MKEGIGDHTQPTNDHGKFHFLVPIQMNDIFIHGEYQKEGKRMDATPDPSVFIFDKSLVF
ncbi:MAG: hypothetical protein R6U46_04145 [Marinilabilia sp.]